MMEVLLSKLFRKGLFMRLASTLLAFVCIAAHAQEPATPSGLDTFLKQAAPVLEGVENASPAALATSTDAPLTLDVAGCVGMALQNNAQTAISDEDVAQAEARIGQAKSARKPQIKTQLGATYIDGLEGIETNLKFLENVIGIGDIQPDKLITRGTVSIEQVLYAGGQISAGIKASKFLAESESWKREITRSGLALETTQAYYDAMLARGLIEVANDSIAAFQKHADDANHAVEAGMASKIVSLRAQTELAARETDLTSANTAFQIALLNLKRLIGTPESQPVTLVGNLAWEPQLDEPATLIARAQTNRAEILALEKGIEAAEQNIRMKKADYKPRAAASAQWQEGVGTGTLQPNGFSAQAGLEWQLYGGGKRKFAVAEAESQVRSLQKQREDVLRLVEMDVRQASLRVNESIEKIRRDKGTVALAEEGFRLAQVRFAEGVSTQTEVLDAELARSQAKTKLVQALRDYAVAGAALKKATGEIVQPQADTDELAGR